MLNFVAIPKGINTTPGTNADLQKGLFTFAYCNKEEHDKNWKLAPLFYKTELFLSENDGKFHIIWCKAFRIVLLK